MQIECVTGKSRGIVDLEAIGCFSGEKSFLHKSLENKKFSGKCGETFYIPASVTHQSGAVLLIGLGDREKFSLQRIRLAVAKLLSQGKAFQYKHLRFQVDSFREKFSLEEIIGAAVEGARFSDYRFDKYKSKPSPKASLEKLELFSKQSGMASKLQSAVKNAEIVCTGVTFTRNVANEPANVLTPEKLAQSAKEMAVKNNLDCSILYPKDMQRLKMGGLLGVAQGSANAARFIILENRVKNPKFKNPIVLVGKGITFDTGGISIKPSNDMDKMKFDMCGAAAVIGAMQVIANLKLPIKVIGLTPVCENMPGSKAQRPGDIVKIMNGKTVEVLNTDAEGRLILADALSYAAKYKPKALVDIATLTGACAATFADLASGVMGTDADLVKRIISAGESTGERCWELPLWEEYFDLIKATYADIQNISKRYAGTITAGMFLKEFADHTTAWAHLDVAGTAWNEGGAKPLSPIGATGIGVRLFVELVKSYLNE